MSFSRKYCCLAAPGAVQPFFDYMRLLLSQHCVVNRRGAASGKGERRLQIHPPTIDNPSAFYRLSTGFRMGVNRTNTIQ